MPERPRGSAQNHAVVPIQSPKRRRGRRALDDEQMLLRMARLFLSRRVWSVLAAARKVVAEQRRKGKVPAHSEQALIDRLRRKFSSQEDQLLLTAKRRERDHAIDRFIAFLIDVEGSGRGLGYVWDFHRRLLTEGYSLEEAAAACAHAQKLMDDLTSSARIDASLLAAAETLTSSYSFDAEAILLRGVLDRVSQPPVGLAADAVGLGQMLRAALFAKGESKL